jgi:hypothetical protein
MKNSNNKNIIRRTTMKHLLLLAITLVFMAGCSTLNIKSPEYQTASDVHGKAYSLAVQVRGTKPVSQIEAVRASKPFYANCQTFSLTVRDMLIERGVDPADIQLAVVRVLPAGFAWVYENGKWGIDKGEMHQVVVWNDMVLDNRFDRVVAREDLNREYGW